MDNYGPISEGGTTNFGKFQSNKYLSGSREFLESNSVIAKLAFLLLIIVLFVLLLRLGITIISWIFSYKSSPILIKGMIDSKEMMIIPQNPSSTGAIPIERSSNRDDGIEFTWSVWLYIDDLTYKQGQFRHVFHKGNDNINLANEPKGMNMPNNAPGLYISPNTNGIVIVMNTFNNIAEEISIDNIPMKKWFNVIIRCNSNILDIFINGTLTRRHMLGGVAKQNYGDVYVSMNGGFSGYTSELRYFNHAIGTSKILSISNAGPNMKMLSSSSMTKSKPPYLSTRWYFMGNENSFNP